MCVAGIGFRSGAQGAFIRGDYVEVGISSVAGFGACSVPAGYHPNVTQWCGGTVAPVLGFVSDPDKDGWAVASPGRANYMGDYFVPGAPYEGWGFQYTGPSGTFNLRYGNDLLGPGCPPGWTCGHLSTVVSGTEQINTWQANNGTLQITQRTVLKKDRLYFVVYVDVENIGTAPVNSMYYFRGLDPDNDEPWLGGGFATDNRIVFQPNPAFRNCLVTANGRGFPTQAYLGLGTKDCRAKCCIYETWPLTASLSDLYAQYGTAAPAAGFYYAEGTALLNKDWAMGVVFTLGNLSPGERTSLAFTYILKQADLDSALGETAPRFESDGSPYSPYTTFRVCPGKKIRLKITNGGQYKWIWTTPSYPHYMAAIGSSTLVPPGGSISSVTGLLTYPFGAVYGDSVEITVWGPKTYTATGISTCDTQYLVFYVDTINFSTPPSLISPVRYCEGTTAIPLSAIAATGARLNWYDSTGSLLSGAPTPSTVFKGPPGKDFDTLDYFVSQTNTAGCETPKALIQVIVTRRPAMPAANDRVYCIGEPTEALEAGGTNLRWYDAATGGSRYTLAPVPLNSKAGIQRFWVSQTVNGCESERRKVDVEISEVKAAFVMSKDSLCGPELLTLTNLSLSSSAGSYRSLWRFGDGATATDSNTSHQYEDKRADYTIYLEVSNLFGCKDSTRRDVSVFPVPEMSVDADTARICQGDAINFRAQITEGYRHLVWDFGDGDPAYDVIQVRHAFTKGGIFSVQLKGQYPACPDAAAAIRVEAVSLPRVDLGPDTAFCPGGATLQLRNRNVLIADKYLWSTGDTNAAINVTAIGTYALRAQNWKCSAADTIEIRRGCYLVIPNGFRPGSGGEDAYFLPRNLLSSEVVSFQMMVFDRWGQLIFESDKTDGRGWDGTFKGQPMPMGVYVYIVRVSFANGSSERYDGNVSLIR